MLLCHLIYNNLKTMDQQLRKQINQLKDQTVILEAQNKLKHEQIKVLENKIKTLTESNKGLKNQFASLCIQTKLSTKIYSQISELQNKLVEMESELENKLKINSKTEQQNIHLRQAIANFKQKQQAEEDNYLEIRSQVEKQQMYQKENIKYISNLYESELKIKDKIIEHLENKINEREKQLMPNLNIRSQDNSIWEKGRLRISITRLSKKLDLLSRQKRNLKQRIKALEAESITNNVTLIKNGQLTYNIEKQKIFLDERIRTEEEQNKLLLNLRNNISYLQQKLRTMSRPQKNIGFDQKCSRELAEISENYRKDIKDLQNKICLRKQQQSAEIQQQIEARAKIENENQYLRRNLEKMTKINKQLLDQLVKSEGKKQKLQAFEPDETIVESKIKILKEEVKMMKKGKERIYFNEQKSFKNEQRIDQFDHHTNIQDKIERLKRHNQELKKVVSK